MLESTVFVDKSLLVQAFLEDTSDVVLLTRPRRWGKSLNMDMLAGFLAVEVDAAGQPLPEGERLHRKLFVGGRVSLGQGTARQLKPLQIAARTDLVAAHLGRYPVISLGLKNIKKVASYAAFLRAIRSPIRRLYSAHGYLLRYAQEEDATLSQADKAQLRRYFSDEMGEEDLTDSLRFLSELLHRHFGQRAYLFIDEYDTPLNHAYLTLGKKDPEALEQVLTFFSTFLGAALKSNPHLQRGFITGILRIAKANLFSDLNNVREYTLLDARYSQAYGFSEAEVQGLLEQVPVDTPLEEIRRWYNGYTFGGSPVRMYNPWSIMCCLGSQGKIDHYWIDSGGTGLVDEALVSDALQHDLQRLVAGGSLTVPIATKISFEDLPKSTGLYSLLLFSGYLNPSVVDPQRHVYTLTIPNYEVRYIYETRLLDWVQRKLEADPMRYYTMVLWLKQGKVDAFAAYLQELLARSSSFHQVGSRRAEVFYSGFMLSLLGLLSTYFHIESEAETGRGRADALLIPKARTGGRQALVLEYKVAAHAKDLEQVAQQGLQQLQDQGYATKAAGYDHVQAVLQCCLAFCGKQVAVAHAQQRLPLAAKLLLVTCLQCLCLARSGRCTQTQRMMAAPRARRCMEPPRPVRPMRLARAAWLHNSLYLRSFVQLEQGWGCALAATGSCPMSLCPYITPTLLRYAAGSWCIGWWGTAYLLSTSVPPGREHTYKDPPKDWMVSKRRPMMGILWLLGLLAGRARRQLTS